MIRFEQVYKRYATGRDALAGVSFEIGAGELAFLTGHSGAGKSSILKLIALIERPTRGQVFVNDRNTAGVGRRAIPQFRRQVGVVFQDHKLLADRPIADNVALASLPEFGRTWMRLIEHIDRIEHAEELVGGLGGSVGCPATVEKRGEGGEDGESEQHGQPFIRLTSSTWIDPRLRK